MKIVVPRRAREAISRKTVRPIRPMVLPSYCQSRRWNHRKFWKLLLRAFQFDVFEQQRRRNDRMSGATYPVLAIDIGAESIQVIEDVAFIEDSHDILQVRTDKPRKRSPRTSSSFPSG